MSRNVEEVIKKIGGGMRERAVLNACLSSRVRDVRDYDNLVFVLTTMMDLSYKGEISNEFNLAGALSIVDDLTLLGFVCRYDRPYLEVSYAPLGRK